MSPTSNPGVALIRWEGVAQCDSSYGHLAVRLVGSSDVHRPCHVHIFFVLPDFNQFASSPWASSIGSLVWDLYLSGMAHVSIMCFTLC